MIDLNLLREDSEKIRNLIVKKEPGFPVEKLIELDTQVRQLRVDVEELRKQRNELAKKGAQGNTPELREKSIELGKQLKTKERELTFQVRGRPPVKGIVKNPDAQLSQIATKAAGKLGLAGTFQCLDPNDNQVIEPRTRLEDLPSDEIVLAPELTPA